MAIYDDLWEWGTEAAEEAWEGLEHVWEEAKKFFNDPVCTVWKTNHLFWQTVAAVNIGQKKGLITSRDDCFAKAKAGSAAAIALGIHPMISDTMGECACKAVFDHGIAPTPTKGASGALHVGSGVARSSHQIDVVARMANNGIYAATWDQNVAEGAWRGWYRLVEERGASASAPTIVSRQPTKLDVFIRGTNNAIYTAAWDANAGWRGWWPLIIEGKGHGVSPVAAVSRDPNKLDVFIRGMDDGIYTAAWDQNVAGGKWQGWWRLVDGKGTASTDLAVVSRDPNKLDVFIRGKNGRIYTAAWDQNVAGGKWRGWSPILDGTARPETSVAGVSRSPDRLDIFMIGADGRVWTAAWGQNVASGNWQGWSPILEAKARAGTSVAAVSRSPDRLDIFMIGADGRVWTAAWGQNVAGGNWQGWWPISDVNVGKIRSVAAISRDPNKLDVIAAGQDGLIYTAAWDQNVEGGKWRGWWEVAE